jgi:hypothetical protein
MGGVGHVSHDALDPRILDRVTHRRTLLADRQLCQPPLGMADVHGFPQVRAGRAALSSFLAR